MNNLELNSKLTVDFIKRFKKKGPGPQLKKRHDKIFNLLKDWVKPNQSIIDLGGREGYLLEKFKKAGYKDLYCIDISEDAIKFLKERGFQGQVGDISENPKLEKRFDLAILSHVLEHCPDPLKVINNVYHNVLKPGGYMFIEVPKENYKKTPTVYGHYYIFNSYKDMDNLIDYDVWISAYRDYEKDFDFIFKKRLI